MRLAANRGRRSGHPRRRLRHARQVQRREEPKAPWDGEESLWIVAPHVPAILPERRTLDAVAPGCYRVDSPFSFLWIAANELPLADELVPFLIARSGRALDAFVAWVKPRRPLPWLLHVLAYLPMSNAAEDDLRSYVFARTDDREILDPYASDARQVDARLDRDGVADLEDVGRHALTRAGDAVDLDDHRGLAERVLTAGDRVDAELAQPRIDAGGGVDRVEDRVDRTVPGERADQLVAVGAGDGDLGVRRPA